jgi:hypothetical protein
LKEQASRGIARELKPHKSINLIRAGETNVDQLLDELYLAPYQGGFVH